ncbi:MAG: protoheme IX farnesyltransferase [Acidobacteria bacterium]|nr:MAG: protoheme IX farnesyltransferase [Acidobacteriota bacterium]
MSTAAENRIRDRGATSRSLREIVFGRLADYWVLTKPEVNFLVVISTLAGYYVALRGRVDFFLLMNTLMGTLMVASGTGTLNQYIERKSDAFMRRTARRPLPAGRIKATEALVFGLLLAIGGGLLLWVEVNPLASVLALLTLTTYLLIYTPLKKRTAFCTLIGAFPGAMPPLIGWAAARGSLDAGSLVLYTILFLWQFPHFLAIAWMYREDYSRAGLHMLPPEDADGRLTSMQIIAFLVALVVVTMIPTLIGQMGKVYLFGAAVLGSYFLLHGARLARRRTNALARRLVMASVLYLPLVFALMMIDKIRL